MCRYLEHSALPGMTRTRLYCTPSKHSFRSCSHTYPSNEPFLGVREPWALSLGCPRMSSLRAISQIAISPLGIHGNKSCEFSKQGVLGTHLLGAGLKSGGCLMWGSHPWILKEKLPVWSFLPTEGSCVGGAVYGFIESSYLL